jgi:hypothetical protein
LPGGAEDGGQQNEPHYTHHHFALGTAPRFGGAGKEGAQMTRIEQLKALRDAVLEALIAKEEG